jgi:thioesterase domain-containing protein
MLDSPDSIGLKGVNLSSKSNLLLAINFQLMSTVMQNPREMAQLLIHRDELDINLRTSSFLKQLIGLARKRGLEENATDLQQAIEKQAKIQESYDILNSHILPLLNANSVQCYYFRNKSGLYLGELEPYFTALDGEIACDHINYWSEWQKQLPNFHIVDLDSPNHMMLLSEPKVYKTITEFCQALYSQQGMTPESFECFKSKAKKKHGIMRQKKQKPKKTHALREKETTVASEEAVT